MIDIEDKNHRPELNEISEYVDNSIFDELCEHLSHEYKAICSIEYSGDKVLLGWNVKFKKAGRTLCTLYPRREHFPMLLVVGKKEKERVESLLPLLSDDFRKVYNNTQEGMGQRWLILDITEHSALYEDVLKIIHIRRESK